MEKLSKAGEKHVPVELALCIAKDVACALVELHSKHIIHRDIKSANILIDIDRKTSDGTPVVKLCDFDRAVPLRSYQHTCCIAHVGIPPPDVCVGTPRWMAPEVLRAMHKQNIYGLVSSLPGQFVVPALYHFFPLNNMVMHYRMLNNAIMDTYAYNCPFTTVI